MGNLCAIALLSVCWTVAGVGGELPASQALPPFPWHVCDHETQNQSCCSPCCFSPMKSKHPRKQNTVLRVGLAYTPLSVGCTSRTKISSRVMPRAQISDTSQGSSSALTSKSWLWGARGQGWAPCTPLLHFWWKKCCLFLFQKRVNCLADFQENILLCSFCINLA